MKGNISKILTNLRIEREIAEYCSLSVFNKKPIPSYETLKSDNYDKAQVVIHDIVMNIENPRLSTRFGKDQNGKSWENTILHHYGELEGTLGADGDPLDVFLGYSCYDENPKIFIVNQYYEDKFDEHKIMFGFPNMHIAKNAYLEQYRPNWDGLHSCKEFSLLEFKDWLKNSDTKKPV